MAQLPAASSAMALLERKRRAAPGFLDPLGGWPLQGNGLGALATLKSIFMPRILSTMASVQEPGVLTDAEYHRLSQAVLASIEAATDRWLQDDVIDIDTHRTGGLLELVFPQGSRIVINTQPPLHELWLAARGGGFHYRHVQGQWRDTRTGGEFFEALSEHASLQAGQALRFQPPGP